jgi:hypothetical protein
MDVCLSSVRADAVTSPSTPASSLSQKQCEDATQTIQADIDQRLSSRTIRALAWSRRKMDGE